MLRSLVSKSQKCYPASLTKIEPFDLFEDEWEVTKMNADIVEEAAFYEM